jgi:hypothetical protein
MNPVAGIFSPGKSSVASPGKFLQILIFSINTLCYINQVFYPEALDTA